MRSGESAPARMLAASIAAGRWDRPFLLVGPAGPARDALARGFGAAVLCTGRADGAGRACGGCGSCHRVGRDLHGDFHALLPGKGRTSVGVDQVEALQAAIALKPVEGHGAVVLIPDAERLTGSAQNALLKTLEEPPPATAMLLMVSAPRALLDTVRSRCAVLRLPPADGALLREAARRGGADPVAAAVLAVAAGSEEGRLEEARESGIDGEAAALAAFLRPGSRGKDPLEGLDGPVAWVRGASGGLEGQRGRLRMALRVLLALHLPEGAPGALPPPLGSGYATLTPHERRSRLGALGEARERVEQNVDPAGILEGLAFAVARADGRS